MTIDVDMLLNVFAVYIVTIAMAAIEMVQGTNEESVGTSPVAHPTTRNDGQGDAPRTERINVAPRRSALNLRQKKVDTLADGVKRYDALDNTKSQVESIEYIVNRIIHIKTMDNKNSTECRETGTVPKTIFGNQLRTSCNSWSLAPRSDVDEGGLNADEHNFRWKEGVT